MLEEFINHHKNQKTLQSKDDFQTQVMTLNSPMNTRKSIFVVKTDPFLLISELQIT